MNTITSLYSQQQLLSFYNALSDPYRLLLLTILYKSGPLCTPDLTYVYGYLQGKSSRHLGYLKDAGLCYSEQVGPRVFFYPRSEARPFMDSQLEFMLTDASLSKALEQYRDALAKGDLVASRL